MEDAPAGIFVCKFVGEILTNAELDANNIGNAAGVHLTSRFSILLDAHWTSETILNNDEALCIDGNDHSNVAGFINHCCHDANLIDIPLKIDEANSYFYHVAFFTKHAMKYNDELTWVSP
jgi:hypothetical protein